jgi:hypothetical protein
MMTGRRGRFFFFGISGAASVEACNAPVERWCTCKRTGAVSLVVGELAQMRCCRKGGI